MTASGGTCENEDWSASTTFNLTLSACLHVQEVGHCCVYEAGRSATQIMFSGPLVGVIAPPSFSDNVPEAVFTQKVSVGTAVHKLRPEGAKNNAGSLSISSPGGTPGPSIVPKAQ